MEEPYEKVLLEAETPVFSKQIALLLQFLTRTDGVLTLLASPNCGLLSLIISPLLEAKVVLTIGPEK